MTEGELPAVTEDVSYYAVFTSQAYFYFVLEGRSNTSTVAKDYMYAGEGTMIVPDGFNSGDRWYDGSNFSIADYIVSTPSDEAIRNGIRAAYADYSPDWTYTIDWTTLSVAGSSVDYRYNTFDYGKSMHTDGALSINKDTTIGVTYLTQNLMEVWSPTPPLMTKMLRSGSIAQLIRMPPLLRPMGIRTILVSTIMEPAMSSTAGISIKAIPLKLLTAFPRHRQPRSMRVISPTRRH